MYCRLVCSATSTFLRKTGETFHLSLKRGYMRLQDQLLCSLWIDSVQIYLGQNNKSYDKVLSEFGKATTGNCAAWRTERSSPSLWRVCGPSLCSYSFGKCADLSLCRSREGPQMTQSLRKPSVSYSAREHKPGWRSPSPGSVSLSWLTSWKQRVATLGRCLARLYRKYLNISEIIWSPFLKWIFWGWCIFVSSLILNHCTTT